MLRRDQERGLHKKIAADPLLRRAAALVQTVADQLQETEPVKRKKVGRRLLPVSRTCLKRVLHLALAFRLTGDKRYAHRAQQEMLAVAAFRDWNPSHFLDVAEMTAALAIGYDWLYARLEPAARATIRRAIVEKGLRASLTRAGWQRMTNNWNQVCHGGLALGALAVMEDHPKLAVRILERAIARVPVSMADYAPDGAYPEGPTYWRYGTTYNVLLISALESALGSDFGLLESRPFLASSDYFLHAAGPTGLFFNYSDSGRRSGVTPVMYWFAQERRQPSLLWRERLELKRFLQDKRTAGRAKPSDPGNRRQAHDASHRFFPLLLVWAEPLARPAHPQTKHWKGGGIVPIAVHRSDWKSAQASFVGVKGGKAEAPHGHMDIGAFVMDANGVRWAEDLGGQSYHDLESRGIHLWDYQQDGQRWDIFRYANFSHNTLVVDGKKQRADAYAPVIEFSDTGPMPHTLVDLSPVYQAQLAAAKRGVGLLGDGSVLVQDEIKALDRRTTVRWAMMTRAGVTLRDKRTAILRQKGQRLVLRVQRPRDAKLELFQTEKPARAHDAPNPGTRMIGFKLGLAPSTSSTLTVVLSPGKEPSPSRIRPLADW